MRIEFTQQLHQVYSTRTQLMQDFYMPGTLEQTLMFKQCHFNFSIVWHQRNISHHQPCGSLPFGQQKVLNTLLSHEPRCFHRQHPAYLCFTTLLTANTGRHSEQPVVTGGTG